MSRYHTGPWTLAGLRDGSVGLPSNGLRVFSTFSCGGGSSMGYKLAGFKVEGFCEIDERMAKVYQSNMAVNHPHVMPIAKLNEILSQAVPDWLHDIDVFDGSPPCSSFSMAGNRESDWGKLKKFNEGQAEQVLDDLFFQYLDTVALIRPRVAIAENVKGLILGDARKYVAEIFLRLDRMGYDSQLFLLGGSRMGVPQRRERTFFVARRRDLGLPKIELKFDEPEITLRQAFEGLDPYGDDISERAKSFWKRVCPNQSFSKGNKTGSWFNWRRLHPDQPAPTVTSSTTGSGLVMWDKPKFMSDAAMKRCQSFPDDYDFADQRCSYVCGMSVPPLMMQRVSGEVARQVFGVS